jgi:hypothetical protein
MSLFRARLGNGACRVATVRSSNERIVSTMRADAMVMEKGRLLDPGHSNDLQPVKCESQPQRSGCR